jgi:hypothetical protein
MHEKGNTVQLQRLAVRCKGIIMNTSTVNTIASPPEASSGIVNASGQLLPWSGETVNRRRMLSATAATGAVLVAPAFLMPAHAAYVSSPSNFFNGLSTTKYTKTYYTNYLRSGRKSWVAYNKTQTDVSYWCTDTPTLYSINHANGDIDVYDCNINSGNRKQIVITIEGTGRNLPAAIIPDKLKDGMPSAFILNWSQSALAQYLGWMEFTKTGNAAKDLWTKLWVWDYSSKAWRVLTYQTRNNGQDITTNMATIQAFMQTTQLCVKDFNAAITKGAGLGLGFSIATALIASVEGFEVGSVFPITAALVAAGSVMYALSDSVSSYSRNLYNQVSQKSYSVVKP